MIAKNLQMTEEDDMTKHEFTGKDVNEAINLACKSLSLSREDLDIEIITPGSTSIFGLYFKKAKIRVSVKQKDQSASHPAEQETRGYAKTKRASARKSKEERPDKKAPHMRETPSVPLQEEKVDTATIAAEARLLLTELLARMGYPSEVNLQEEGKSLKAQINGEHSEALTAEDGQVLDSLQYLLRKMLSKKFAQKILISVDAGDFRAARREELVEMARAIAREVKETGKNRAIPAMNPADRRIVHMAIQHDEAIRSRSIGEGIFKKIIIYQPGKGGKRSTPRRRSRRPEQS